ncbi:hypothetical protein BU25DRAFT_220414 [Macroventuria anomochaeta]|uniref:Uncharacterized protein n=1 Tax=Macroventuria anomochaeta TaxID=301207 RepID=A0ACB6SA57_9PLEO|nr:uncharacterized protein BU25DRAFT_220414 [Macroventuria anomochaeta]KAF2630933.1 hypothetical protein BU25DRAFT_220414 [Macroventuria anomochaeta]
MSWSLLGVSDAHKQAQKLCRDGACPIEAHRGVGRSKRTWQSSGGDVCLGFACSGCALIARHFCSAQGLRCLDCDRGNNRQRQLEVLLVGSSIARGSAGGKQRAHCCCRVVDEKGKARNKLPGDWRALLGLIKVASAMSPLGTCLASLCATAVAIVDAWYVVASLSHARSNMMKKLRKQQKLDLKQNHG